MKSCLLLLTFAFSYCSPGSQIGIPRKHSLATSHSVSMASYLMDFNVQRLSNSRVHLSWHVKEQNMKVLCHLVRKIGRDGTPQPLLTIEPRQTEGIADYSHTDQNVFRDSSYYGIMLEDEKGTKYYSRFIGVEGIRK